MRFFKHPFEQSLYWTPRFIAIFFILFISVFAADVLVAHQPIEVVLLKLLIHLIPSMILTTALFIAWREEDLGALVFVGLAFLMLFMSNLIFQVIYTTVTVLIGVLFLIHFLIIHRRNRFRPHK